MLQRQVRLGRAMSAVLEVRSASVTSLGRLMSGAMDAALSRRRVALDALGARRCLSDPAAPLRDLLSDLLQTEERLHDAVPRGLARDAERCELAAGRLAEAGGRLLRPAEATLARLAASLDALSPLSVLARGYAIARDASGRVVKRASDVACGDQVSVLLGEGSVEATVSSIRIEDRA